MPDFDDLKNKAEQAAQDHPEQAEKISDEAVQRGGDAADQATDDKHSEQIDKLQEKADKSFGS